MPAIVIPLLILRIQMQEYKNSQNVRRAERAPRKDARNHDDVIRESTQCARARVGVGA